MASLVSEYEARVVLSGLACGADLFGAVYCNKFFYMRAQHSKFPHPQRRGRRARTDEIFMPRVSHSLPSLLLLQPPLWGRFATDRGEEAPVRKRQLRLPLRYRQRQGPSARRRIAR